MKQLHPFSYIPFRLVRALLAFALLPLWAVAWTIACMFSKKFLDPLEKPFEDVDDFADMTGKVIIVTGSNTGIGKRTAYQMARFGGIVILACRNEKKGAEAEASLRAELNSTPDANGGEVHFMQLDLSNFESVKAFAVAFRAKYYRLDVLINNAGVGHLKSTTPDGYDLVFHVNFVGHYLLTMLLMDMLKNTKESRVVNLASVMHHFAQTDFHGSYTRSYSVNRIKPQHESYHDSKLAMILFTMILRETYGMNAIAVNPGAVHSDIWRWIPKGLKKNVVDPLMDAYFLTCDQGCYTSVTGATRVFEDDVFYIQPYWIPTWTSLPFEIMGPFKGATPMEPSLPSDLEAAKKRLLEAAALTTRQYL